MVPVFSHPHSLSAGPSLAQLRSRVFSFWQASSNAIEKLPYLITINKPGRHHCHEEIYRNPPGDRRVLVRIIIIIILRRAL
jgi:hypothetical protein